MLYNSENFSEVEIKDYLSQLSNILLSNTDFPDLELELNIQDDLLSLDILIPCALILSELISNFLKYAYSKEKYLSINYSKINDKRIISVRDKGPGYPDKILLSKKYDETLGVDLIFTLSEQIDGTVNLKNDNGAVTEITF